MGCKSIARLTPTFLNCRICIAAGGLSCSKAYLAAQIRVESTPFEYQFYILNTVENMWLEDKSSHLYSRVWLLWYHCISILFELLQHFILRYDLKQQIKLQCSLFQVLIIPLIKVILSQFHSSICLFFKNCQLQILKQNPVIDFHRFHTFPWIYMIVTKGVTLFFNRSLMYGL